MAESVPARLSRAVAEILSCHSSTVLEILVFRDILSALLLLHTLSDDWAVGGLTTFQDSLPNLQVLQISSRINFLWVDFLTEKRSGRRE